MNYERILTEVIQEHLVYYTNGQRFCSNVLRGGKSNYRIIGADRYVSAENIKCAKKSNVGSEEYDIGISGYNTIKQVLSDIGELSNLLISIVWQKKMMDFDGNLQDEILTIYYEVNAVYKVDGKKIPISRSGVIQEIQKNMIRETIIQCAKEIHMQYKILFTKRCLEINSQKYDVILSAGVGGLLIHEGIGHNLEADTFFKKESLLNGSIGKKVFDKKITIIDRCNQTDFINYRLSADGSMAQKVYLVKKGVIEQVMSDRFTSIQYQIPDTGNGRSATFENIVIPRMRNTYLENGSVCPSDMINNMNYGIIALETGGGSVNVSTGEFLMNVALGGLINNGEIVGIIPHCIIKGNVLSTLNCIEEIGNDLKFKFAKCIKDGQEIGVSYGCPTLKLSQQELFL